MLIDCVLAGFILPCDCM